MELIKGKTSTGFEFEFNRANIDMELMDDLTELQDNPAITGRVLMRLLGKEQKKRLYDHVRDETGHVSIEKTAAELIDIFKGIENGKNF